MTYLPPLHIDGTEFPQPLGEDLVTAIGLIEEQWRMMYPKVVYTPIAKQTNAVPDPSVMSGTPGNTKFDTLWGESVDKNMATWEQPQLNGTLSPVDPAVYKPGVPIHCRLERGVRETQLKKFGFDLLRNIVATIPTSMLDAAGITVTAGDRFEWNGETFEVLQWYQQGWYYSNNIILHIVMSVQTARKGS